MSYESTILARSPSCLLPLTDTAFTVSGGQSYLLDASTHGYNGQVPSYSLSSVLPAGDQGPLVGEGAVVLAAQPGPFAFNDQIDLPEGVFPAIQGSWTVEVWLKFDESTLPNLFTIYLPSAAGPFAQLYVLKNPSTSLEQVGFYANSTGLVSMPWLHPWCWHSYCATFDGTTLTAYRDGVTMGTVDTSSWPFYPVDAPVGVALWTERVACAVNYFAVYPTVLSADAVAANYATATPRQDADCFVVPDWLRLIHASGQGLWRTRGDISEVWASGTLQEKWPYASLGSTPSTLVGQDPVSHLPAFCPAPSIPPPPPGGDLPAGTEPGDLLWWDGAAWQVLSPDGVPGHVLTEVTSGGGAVLPEWGGALASDSAIMCGMARFLAEKIQVGFDWVRTQTLLAISLYIHDSSIGVSALLAFYTLLDPAFVAFTGPLTQMQSGIASGSIDQVAAAFPPLTPGQLEGIVCACYCGLHDTTGTGALTTTTLDAIRGYIDAYPNWIAASDGHYYQKEAIDVVLQTDLDWATWADIGSHQPQETCGHCSCG